MHAIEHFVEHELQGFTDGKYVEGDGTVAATAHVHRLQIRYAVNRTGLQPDVFENVLHFIRTDSGNVGTLATATQMGAVETAWGTFHQNARGWIENYIALDAYRWYGLTLADPLGGPPLRVTDVTNVAGTQTLGMPSQVATSITMRTAMRRHWGRVYIPGSRLGSEGLVTSTDVTSLAGYFRTFVNSASTAGLTPVIFARDRQAVMSISAVEVDNVPDVIRRRRPKASTFRSILTS